MTQAEYIEALREHLRSVASRFEDDTEEFTGRPNPHDLEWAKEINALLAIEPEPCISAVKINGELITFPAGSSQIEVTINSGGMVWGSGGRFWP